MKQEQTDTKKPEINEEGENKQTNDHNSRYLALVATRISPGEVDVPRLADSWHSKMIRATCTSRCFRTS